MNYELKNQYLTATFSALGAELTSLKDAEGTEYIWNADERYWKRHTPILFPIVGKIREGKYIARGKEYALPPHGFARDMVFGVESQSHSSIAFILNASEHTKKMYPFEFTLKVIYTLEDQNLAIRYEVQNKDAEDMFFKIGAHPGFMCPFFQNEKIEDYYLEFEKEEEMTEIPVTEDAYLANETKAYKSKKIPLRKSLFDGGAIVYTNYKNTSMALASVNHDKRLTVSFEGFPYLGVWSLPNEAPFVCIEPWHGHADFVNESLIFEDKKDIITLQPGSSFSCMHRISVS